jgi:hypothetical protein
MKRLLGYPILIFVVLAGTWGLLGNMFRTPQEGSFITPTYLIVWIVLLALGLWMITSKNK